MPVVGIIDLCGFYQKNGMTLTEIIRNVIRLLKQKPFTYEGMVYTLLFQELYRQARFFGGKLPLDVGFWFDEFPNIKMPNNFDKILATCRSRGVYCVPILQSLA